MIAEILRYPGPYYAYAETPTAIQVQQVYRHRGLYHGDGYIAGEPSTGPSDTLPDGIVRRNNVPAALRVALFDQVSMRAVADTWSASDGTYRIEGLKRLNADNTPVLYFAIAFDNVPTHNAGIQDRVTLKQM